MSIPAFRRNTVPLVLAAVTAALIAREVARNWLVQNGYAPAFAADLSYFVVPPAMVLLMFPLWRDARIYIARCYQRADLSLNVVVVAIAIGVLIRLTWWGTTFARVSFGWTSASGISETIGPHFSWQCPAPVVLVTGILVMAVVVPIIEEITHRGYIYRAALRWNVPAAVIVSSIVFTVFHKFDSWITVFLIGIVFAIQFQRTGSLWSSTITHATYNFLIQFDWRCLRGRWLVADREIPVLDVGVASLAVCALTIAAICALLVRLPGADYHPGQDPT
ncbi:MAG: CPBP family intramembrane glutamic endopeptidase [Pseudomonadota bacterium]